MGTRFFVFSLVEQLDVLTINDNAAVFLHLLQAAQQRIFLNTEVVGQSLTRHRDEDTVGLLSFAFLFQEQSHFLPDIHRQHTNLLGQETHDIRHDANVVLGYAWVAFDEELDVLRLQAEHLRFLHRLHGNGVAFVVGKEECRRKHVARMKHCDADDAPRRSHQTG